MFCIKVDQHSVLNGLKIQLLNDRYTFMELNNDQKNKC